MSDIRAMDASYLKLFDPPLMEARLIRRYKRFLADVLLDGETLTVHVPNSGSMKGLLGEGRPVLLSKRDNPKRKLSHTLEMVAVGKDYKGWAGVNTSLTNHLVARAIEKCLIAELDGWRIEKAEAVAEPGSRLDFVLTDGAGGRLWLEVKNVTLVEGNCVCFPDAVTVRGRKHLQVLARKLEAGERAAMFYLVQRPEGEYFTVAGDIDPDYENELRSVIIKGVQIICYRTLSDHTGIKLVDKLPYKI